MATILDRILETKREEVRALLKTVSVEELRSRAKAGPPALSFYDALTAPGPPHLIAEVKKASPSKGVIREDFDPVRIAKQYEAGGAAALSVLTDEQYFQGNLEYLQQIRGEVNLPLLRKDFVIDEVQVYQARAAGASAVLLIAACLEPEQLAELYAASRAAGQDVLVEVHDDEDTARLEDSGCPARIVGINNRDLRTFEVDLAVTERLAARLKDRDVLVAESGIFTYGDVDRVARAGAKAVLVGESLMRQDDPAAAARVLMTSPDDL